MTRPIVQSVTFKVPAEELFTIFTDSKKHTAATGQKAKVSAKVGARWTAYDGSLEGKNLVVIPGKMIVQTWRSTMWHADDPDSVLVLTFSEGKGGGKIDLVHVGVPEHDHEGVTEGWPRFYWAPWKAYLKGLTGRPRPTSSGTSQGRAGVKPM